MKKIKLLLLMLLTLPALGQKKNLIFEDNFDKKISWYENSMHFPYSANIVDYVSKAKGKSLKVELYKPDGQIRAELGTSYKLSPKEGWFGFALYFPTGYIPDKYIESIVQWQGYPDFNLGEKWRSAPLFLGTLNGKLILDMRNDDKPVTIQGVWKGTSRVILGDVELNKWQNFVFHIRWSPFNDGFIEVWKNGVKVYSKLNQPTSYYDTYYPYFKIGIYKWDVGLSAIKDRVIYIDEVRIGNEKATYNDVYPLSK